MDAVDGPVELRGSAEPPVKAETRRHPGSGGLARRVDLMPLVAVGLLVAVTAALPVIRTHLFYYWDDSAAVFLPSWYLIGEQLREGSFPLLNVDVWMGGNWAGEAQFGIWNPVLLANCVLVSLLPDLAIAAIIIKTEFLVLLGTGVYLLAREYRSRPAAAVVVAVALPFSGYTLFFDASTWAAGLIAFSFLPHFWWTIRRFARGHLHPIVPLVVGLLMITAGSPYAVIGVIVVLAAVGAERLAIRDARSLIPLAVLGLAIGITGALVFLPNSAIQAVGWRAKGGVYNNGLFVPSLGQLLNLSAPSYQPRIVPGQPELPLAYLSWFIVPLLAWFPWSTLARGRARVGLLVFGTVYLLLALAPSQLWLFRWPARLIEYVYLPVCVLVALLLSGGLRTDRVVMRSLASFGLIAGQAYLSWADLPGEADRHLGTAAIVLVLVALALLAHRYLPRLLTPTLVAGSVAILATQLYLYPGNSIVTPWHFPHNIARLQADFADRRDGNIITIAGYPGVKGRAHPDGAWRDLLFGNVSQVAGMASLNSYTGMGFKKFSDRLCMNYYGGVCPDAYQSLFTVEGDTGRPLADLLRLNTIVVRNGYLRAGSTFPAAGWEISRRTDLVTVARRTQPLPNPDGRVSWTAPSVAMNSDHVVGRVDEEFRYTGGGRVIVAALAWPGWRATVDGDPVPLRSGPAGLIELDLPQRDAESTLRLSFEPEGLRPGLGLAAAGIVLGAAYCVVYTVLRRRSRGSASGSEPTDHEPPPDETGSRIPTQRQVSTNEP
jgi:hypothetical protein